MEEFAHIKQNLDAVMERIRNACAKAGRREEEISLLAVSKMHTADEVSALVEAGARLIGENRVQEAEAKRPQIRGEFEFHMIGHLQSNKADKAVKLFDVVQSVDSLKLARMLSDEAVKRGRRLKAFVQVNSSGEESKSGFEPSEVPDEAARIAELPGIELCGLMTIGPLTDDEDEIRRALAGARRLFEKLQGRNPAIRELSMGMTGDLEIAVEEGTTMLRIGTALFGRR